jgi:hypothetical protein
MENMKQEILNSVKEDNQSVKQELTKILNILKKNQ